MHDQIANLEEHLRMSRISLLHGDGGLSGPLRARRLALRRLSLFQSKFLARLPRLPSRRFLGDRLLGGALRRCFRYSHLHATFFLSFRGSILCAEGRDAPKSPDPTSAVLICEQSSRLAP